MIRSFWKFSMGNYKRFQLKGFNCFGERVIILMFSCLCNVGGHMILMRSVSEIYNCKFYIFSK